MYIINLNTLFYFQNIFISVELIYYQITFLVIIFFFLNNVDKKCQ